MQGEELRKEPRIMVQDLPEAYARFNVLLAQGKETTVDTIDASANGFGFFSELAQDEFIRGGRIVLYPVGSEVPVYGQIVHTAATDKGTRVGVRLLQIGGYKQYNETISKLLAAHAG